MITIPQCAFCAHFRSHKGIKSLCVAFPMGIPQMILDNKHDHRLPYPGDNGIFYEATETAIALFGEQGPFAEPMPMPAPLERAA